MIEFRSFLFEACTASHLETEECTHGLLGGALLLLALLLLLWGSNDWCSYCRLRGLSLLGSGSGSGNLDYKRLSAYDIVVKQAS